MKVGDIVDVVGLEGVLHYTAEVVRIDNSDIFLRFFDEYEEHQFAWREDHLSKIETDLTPEQYKFMLML